MREIESREIDRHRSDREIRRQNAAILLSSVGAAVAGAGVGMMAASSLMGLKWLVLGVGTVMHLTGMIGRRRLQREQSYQLARWEKIGYWLCWAALAVLGAYAAATLIQTAL